MGLLPLQIRLYKLQLTYMKNEPEYDPLTLAEIQKEAGKRISKITGEFINGFRFIQGHPRSVTFFGSARFDSDNKYYDTAKKLAGRIVTELGYSVLSGGGPGIMEAANRGAFEKDGHSLGLSIKLPSEQGMNRYVTNGMEFNYFFSRKVCLSFAAEAYLFFPGGFGTMDEFFEILTLVQTHKIEKVPIFLVGKDFWGPLHDFIINNLIRHKTVSPADIDLYRLTDNLDEIIDTIKKSPVRSGYKKI